MNAHRNLPAASRGVHPTEKTLRRFAVGTTSPAENRAVVIHLLRRCDQCSRALAAACGGMARLFRQSGERAS